MVPKPKVASLMPKDNKVPSSPPIRQVSATGSTYIRAPRNTQNKAVDIDIPAEPRPVSVTMTLAEEVNHFVKTNTTSSEEEFIAFIIAANVRRYRAGKGVNAPMEVEMGNAAKPISFHPLTLDTAMGGLLKVKPPAKDA